MASVKSDRRKDIVSSSINDLTSYVAKSDDKHSGSASSCGTRSVVGDCKLGTVTDNATDPSVVADTGTMSTAGFIPKSKLTCKWCKRSSDSGNPLAWHSALTLPWFRKQGRQCIVCPWFQSWHLHYKDISKDKLERDLEDAAFHTQYMTDLRQYETTRNDCGGKAPRQYSVDVSVQGRQTFMTQIEKVKGYLWPLSLFEEVKGRKATRRETTCVQHGGKPLRGYFTQEYHERAVIIRQISQDAVDRVAEVANSKDQLDPSQIEKTWQAGVQTVQYTSAKRKYEKHGDCEILYRKRKAGWGQR